MSISISDIAEEAAASIDIEDRVNDYLEGNASVEQQIREDMKDALRDKIGNKWVTIKTSKDKKGKYGRWLGEVWIENVCVNDWLISEGLAEVYK